jgi:hypothetical protein
MYLMMMGCKKWFLLVMVSVSENLHLSRRSQGMLWSSYFLRAATIRCKKETHFAVLNKQDYQKVLGKIEEK